MNNKISSELIKLANKKASTEFMNFPEYDKDNPITDLESALVVLLNDELDELETSEVYDFLCEKLKRKTPQGEFSNQIEKLVENSDMFTDFFKENPAHLLNLMNRIIDVESAIRDIEQKNSTNGKFLVLEVLFYDVEDIDLIVEHRGFYMAECRNQFSTTEGENIFSFSLAVDFHQRYFGSLIFYDSDLNCYYDKNQGTRN